LYLWINSLTNVLPSNLPRTLTGIDLGWNQINGSIPNDLPVGFTNLNVHNNMMSGSIPSTLPNTISVLAIDSNFFSGIIPLLPMSIAYIVFWYHGTVGNQLSGQVILNKPVQIYLDYNYITDLIVLDYSSLTDCDISYTPLLNNPHIQNLTMCTQNGLYNASSLPITVTESLASSTRSEVLATTQPITHSDTQTKTTPAKQPKYKTTTNTMPIFLVIETVYSLEQWLRMCLRLLFNTLLAGIIIYKTPFQREFKSKLKNLRTIKQGSEYEL
jgi:hypothetical protein